ncbi:MAG: hypothetical protein DSO01_07640 [Archaeoglobi archaeon]|jgi:hypothetical protein|nr:MAG: hypothetical protein DSO01_07640 [Archaeoglobi archaeon]TDA30378.1 MAG: hypothetical protein DSO00_01595 [Archaeoglobi archaeon]
MLDDSELKAIRSAVSDFIKSEIEKESDLFKIWKEGFSLGYFDLSSLKPIESSTVFSAVHEINPEVGSRLLYLSLSNFAFGDLASLSLPSDGYFVTDWDFEKYVIVADEVRLIKASTEFLTTEISKLRNLEVIESKKVNMKPILNVLLASRCVGTALHAFNLALKYLKETKLNKNYYHVFEKLGEILVEIRASELLTKFSALQTDSKEAEKITAMALWKSAVTAVMAVDEAVMVQEGAYRYLEEFKVGIFRDMSVIKHRNPKMASIYNLKISELYYPKTADFFPKI